MSSDYDLITGEVVRTPLELPASFRAKRRFLRGYGKRGKGTKRGFLLASSTENGYVSSFEVYADLNNNRILDSNDLYIGYGDVQSNALGLYESLSVGQKGYFASEGGSFDIGWNGSLVASGEIF